MYDSDMVQFERSLKYIIDDVYYLIIGELYLLLFDIINEMSQISKLLILGHDGESMIDTLHVMPKIDQ